MDAERQRKTPFFFLLSKLMSTDFKEPHCNSGERQWDAHGQAHQESLLANPMGDEEGLVCCCGAGDLKSRFK